MAQCKHQTGTLQQHMAAFETRHVIRGELDPDNIEWGQGNIQGYSYKCALCARIFFYTSPYQRGLAKWLVALHGVAYPDG